MKRTDVKGNRCINIGKEVNDKDPKFKVGDHVRVSKYQNIYAKGYKPNCSEEIFVIREIENTVPLTYVINDRNDEEIVGKFYETKTDLKNASHVDVSSFALKSDSAILKTEVDKLYIDKLTPVPNDLAKLSNVIKNDVVEKTAYDKSVTKVDNIDTTRFNLKTTYDTDKSDLEKKISEADKKIPDTSDLAEKTDLNAKITEIEGKIHNITGLSTNSALTAVENKIPNVSSLVKKTDYNTKTSENKNKFNNHNHGKCITTSEFNYLTARVFMQDYHKQI